MCADGTGAGSLLIVECRGQLRLCDCQVCSVKSKKEALALVWSLQHFDVYVGGRPLVVYTDHNPLTFLQSLKCPNQRLRRWSLFLQAYALEIRHIKGVENVIADALSRAPLL